MVDFAESSSCVRVRIPMSVSNWTEVVIAGAGVGVVFDERIDHFVIEYPSREVAENEFARWEGLVEYRVLPDEENRGD
jgi:hypothetical protein